MVDVGVVVVLIGQVPIAKSIVLRVGNCGNDRRNSPLVKAHSMGQDLKYMSAVTAIVGHTVLGGDVVKPRDSGIAR
jgi:hypothetical protein